MPVRLRASKRRAENVSDIEYATILAGFRGDTCPDGGNPFVHLDSQIDLSRGRPCGRP
jgi:hypothetical protein